MAEYVTKEQVIDWFRPYGHMDEFIPYETMVSDLRGMPAADVAPVRHGRWERVIPSKSAAKWSTKVSCSNCHSAGYAHHKYCPNCGAKMDEARSNEH